MVVVGEMGCGGGGWVEWNVVVVSRMECGVWGWWVGRVECGGGEWVEWSGGWKKIKNMYG